VLSTPPRMSFRGLWSLAWLLVAPKLMPDTSFNSFASYSLWPVIPVTEPIPSAPAAAAWTIPQVIVTSPTDASVQHVEYSEEAKMPLPGDEDKELSAICTTASLELATLGSITEEHANEAALTSHESSISLAHTYVHGGDLFTIVEADEPLESSLVESNMPRFVPGLATLSSLTYVASSTLLSLPSPFSRGNLCIKDIDALMSSESETESCVFVPFSALRSHQPTFQIFDDAFLLCLGRRRIRPLPWPSRHPRESAFCPSVPLARQP
jgi:hypothetical protein